MAVTVELGAFNGFTLDDPVLGLLDSGILDGGIDYVDVSDALISVSAKRGRSRDLERTSAGQLSVDLRNENRAFDPLNYSSPLQPYVVPRKPVRVFADGTPVFTGVVDDWNFSYNMGGVSVASLGASDAFSLFAREENAGGSAVQQGSGARIGAVLDQLSIAWPALDRDIDTGNTTLLAGPIQGNALTYLQDVEESEAGLIYMSKDGKVSFRERLIQPVSSAVMFGDDLGIPYDAIEIAYGTEQLANAVTVTSAAGTATASDATSQEVYGLTEVEKDTLLVAGDLQGLADYIIARYSTPEYRIQRIRVSMRALTQEQQTSVLSLELGGQADVRFTPNRIGQPISIRNRIIGISHDVDPDSHFVSFSFEELPFDFFILDDAVFGILDDDAGVLGF
jgi:hypothetical protein